MKFVVIIKMRNNVVLCANKTVKSNVLHPCVDTLKKKLQAFELQHMVQNSLCRTSKERAPILQNIASNSSSTSSELSAYKAELLNL